MTRTLLPACGLTRAAMNALVIAAAVTAGCGGGAAPAPATTALDPATTGTVTGKVRLDGVPPPAQLVRMDGDKTCAKLVPGAERATERYIVGDGGTLGNVFVYVTTGLERRSFPIPDQPVVLDQQRCWYTPRVIGVRVGQPFQILNSDPLLHNVRAAAEVNEPFNQGQPVQGMRYSHTFSTEEVMVPLKCDVHAWMNAWVGVVNHPYFAVTGPDGAFSLPNLPAGTYTVAAWHEAAGVVTGTATVTAQGLATLDLTMKVPAA
ncbi:MAG: carboxypeptidase regulatory-like domain-containing protein [Acidobacteriota bacterium]